MPFFRFVMLKWVHHVATNLVSCISVNNCAIVHFFIPIVNRQAYFSLWWDVGGFQPGDVVLRIQLLILFVVVYYPFFGISISSGCFQCYGGLVISFIVCGGGSVY